MKMAVECGTVGLRKRSPICASPCQQNAGALTVQKCSDALLLWQIGFRYGLPLLLKSFGQFATTATRAAAATFEGKIIVRFAGTLTLLMPHHFFASFGFFG